MSGHAITPHRERGATYTETEDINITLAAAEQLLRQVHSGEEAYEVACTLIEKTATISSLEGQPFFQKTEEYLLCALIDYLRLYGRPSKMTVQSIYGFLAKCRINNDAYQEWNFMSRMRPNDPEPESELDRCFQKAAKRNNESMAVMAYGNFKGGLLEDSVYIDLIFRLQTLLEQE